MTASYNRDGGRKTESGMAAEYDEFECRLRERLLTIAEEIETAKESGRASLADPTNKIGRALAAQQIKIKEAERSRVAAMLAGVQQQQSELQMATFTSDYVKLMQTSSRVGPSLSEKQVSGVVNAYQNRLDGTHAVGSLLTDSAEDTLETSIDGGVNFLTQSDEDDSEAYAKLFGVPAAPGPPADPVSVPAPVSEPAPAPAAGGSQIAPLPEVPSGPPSAARAHRRAGSIGSDLGVGWLYANGK